MAVKKETKSGERYVEGVGRRKTAIARVRIRKGADNKVMVNDAPMDKFFQMARLRKTVLAPLTESRIAEKFAVTAKVAGGGVKAQAEAVRHGLARALADFDPEFKAKLRGLGYLTRDSRMVERKKYGLKKARRAPQWAKR